MIKLCVFDLDGTLVNSLEDLAYCMNQALEKHGQKTHPVESFRFMAGNGMYVLAQRCLPENASKELVDKVFADFTNMYKDHYADKSTAYKGINDLLAALSEKGIKAAVISNKVQEFTECVVQKIFSFFDFCHIIGNSDKFPSKPDPAGLLYVLEQTGTSKEECLYIGDTNVDMQTAKNAGVTSVGVLWGFRQKQELLDSGAGYIVEKPLEIMKIIGEK